MISSAPSPALVPENSSCPRYSALVESIQGIVWEFDVARQRFTYVSPMAETILGYPVHRWIDEATFWPDHIHDDDRWVISYCEQQTRAGKGHEFEYRMIAADGRVVWLRDSVAVSVEDGRASTLRGIMIDISDLKAAAAALKQTGEAFRQAIDFAALGFYESTVDGRLITANAKFAEILGYDSVSEALEVGFESFFADPLERQALVKEFNRSVASGRAEIQWIRKDQRAIWVEIHTRVIRDGSGEASHFEGFIADITMRREAERAKQESERRFRSLVENARDMILIVDRDGVIRYHSPAVSRVLGYGEHHLGGWVVFGIVHDADLDSALRTFRECAAQTGSIGSLDCRLRHRDGSWRKIECVATNLMDVDGVRGIVINARDITDRELLREQLDQNKRMASLGRLSATVAHEFNNVLMAIQPFAEVIQRSLHGDRFEEPIRHILSAVKRGKRITEEILRFSRPANPNVRPIRVESWLTRLAAEARQLAPQARILVECSWDVGVIAGDDQQLEQVLVNLILNARDAIDGDGSITLGARKLHHGVELFVRDTGCGIDPDDLDRIFEPLFTTKPHGTGLGLAVAHGVIMRHGGRIYAESWVGVGTTFHMILPDSPGGSEPSTFVTDSVG